MATPRKNWIKIAQQEIAEYRKLAKRANQRMVRLERYSDPTSDMYRSEAKEVKKFAYKVAQRDIKAQYGPQATRFKENYKINKEWSYDDNDSLDDARDFVDQLRKVRKSVETFLQSASSTLQPAEGSQGLRAVYDKRTDTINTKYIEKYGVKGLTPDELAKFFASKKFQKILDDKQYGSEYMFVVAAAVKEVPLYKTEIREYLKDHIDINMNVDDLMDLDILDEQGQIDEDKLEGIKDVDNLRDLFNFVKFSNSSIIQEKIVSAIKGKYSGENLFF